MSFALDRKNGRFFLTKENSAMRFSFSSPRPGPGRTGHFLLGLLLLGALSPALADVPDLTNEETDGFLQWMHSLEQSVASREASGAPAGHLLFPFDQPGWDRTEIRPYRHLAIAKAILELEAQWLLRGSKKEESALVALAHARNYTHISEYDSAMVWYEIAAQLDTLSLFDTEIGRERMGVTVAAGDSVAMAHLVTNTLGLSDLTGRERQVILVYRWLLTNRDRAGLELLLQKIEGQPGMLQKEILFWHAYAESWLGRRESCLERLRSLVRAGGLSQGLTENQRAWVLVAIPDLLFLLDEPLKAKPLYDVLAGSSLETLTSWSNYQLANLNFLKYSFEQAANSFSLACEAPRQGAWQDHACRMAQLARELERIQKQGEPYGTNHFYQH
jgi:hypothetical protein